LARLQLLWSRMATIWELCQDCVKLHATDPRGTTAYQQRTAVFLAMTVPRTLPPVSSSLAALDD